MSLYSKLWYGVRNPREAVLCILFGYRNYTNLKSALNEMRQYCRIKPQNALETQMLRCTDIRQHLMTLYMLTKQLNLKCVLELGTREGESTVALLSAAEEIGGMVTSIDIADCPQAKCKIDSLGLSKFWRFINADDLSLEWNMPIDHLFIDTSHTYEHTLNELCKFEPWVKVGGIMTLHDIISCPNELRAIYDYIGERKDLQLYKYFNNSGLAVIFKG